MINTGSKVTFHFTMRSEGAVVTRSEIGKPYAYVHGEDPVLPGLEDGLTGMSAGETKTIVAPPDRAFGPWDPDAVRTVPKTSFRQADLLAVGDRVRGKSEGEEFTATVTAMDEAKVTIDANHPLAGKTIEFDVEVVEVA